MVVRTLTDLFSLYLASSRARWLAVAPLSSLAVEYALRRIDAPSQAFNCIRGAALSLLGQTRIEIVADIAISVNAGEPAAARFPPSPMCHPIII